METIIVTTDFSAAAANALDYACGFAKDVNARIVLAHIFNVPAGYAAEGLSLVSVNDAIDSANERLQQELERASVLHKEIPLEARMMVDNSRDALQQLNKELNPAMIAMGAVAGYSELWEWDNDWLDILLSFPCPVLVVPGHIVYSPMKNIAFACDYQNQCVPSQTDKMKRLVQLTGANFYVVHIDTGKLPVEATTSHMLKEAFGNEINPQFVTIENKQVIAGIAAFERQYDIDLLLVTPRRHGIWHNLFNKSYSKQLMQLNNLPVMAIH